jgi:hypothetical protein
VSDAYRQYDSTPSTASLSSQRVILHSPTGYSVPRRRPQPVKANRITGWIVRSIILATTAFALIDLFLLGSGLHH